MNAISNSQRLREWIAPALPELSAATTAVITHPRFPELCPEFLVTVHQMIRASVPLMRAALARSRELEAADPVAAAMVPYLTHHIREEMHHDDWLLEDLESIGVARAEVLRRMPPPAVASAVGAQYYWIHHHHPVAKLGQIAVMEGYPPTPETIDLLVEQSGFPRRAFRTMEKHCHLDTHHRDEFDEALDGMPLGEEHHAIIQASALHTIRAGAEVYRELLAPAAGADGKAAGQTPQAGVMPARRPGLSAQRRPEGGYRLEDAVSGAVYQIGEQEHFLLTQCDGRTSVETVRRAFIERFGQPLDGAELDDFLRMMDEEQLISTGAAAGH